MCIRCGCVFHETQEGTGKHGKRKNRFPGPALYTDALRAELLEQQGYRTQILEFIDMEHTPKNILLRAVYEGKPKHNEKEIREILDFLQITPTLYELLGQKQIE